MYAGDGKTIEAASTKLGIIESKVNTKKYSMGNTYYQ